MTPHHLILILALTASAAHAATIAFDSQAEVQTALNRVGTQKLTAGSTGGLSGSLSGTVDNSYTNSTLVSKTGITAGSTTPSFTLSLYFQASPIDSSTGATQFLIGFTNSPTHDAFSNDHSHTYFGLGRGAFFDTFNVFAGSSDYGKSSTVAAFTSGNWYKLQMSAVWNSAGLHYTVLGRIYNSDADGNQGSVFYSDQFDDSLRLSNYPNGLFSYMAFSGPVGDAGTRTIDNFTYPVVPEPQNLFVLGLAGLIATGLNRNRRHCNRVNRLIRHYPYAPSIL
jgi:hypothetical protein